MPPCTMLRIGDDIRWMGMGEVRLKIDESSWLVRSYNKKQVKFVIFEKKVKTRGLLSHNNDYYIKLCMATISCDRFC